MEKLSLAMLVTAADLPGPGWKALGQQTWPMGGASNSGELSRRAGKQGGIAALRRFRQDDPERGLFVQLSPFASESDVTQALEIVRGADEPTWSGVERLEKRDVPGIEVEGLEHLNAWEHRNRRGDLTGFQRFIQGNVAHVAVMASGSMLDPGWSWDDLIVISSIQAARVRACLDLWSDDTGNGRP